MALTGDRRIVVVNSVLFSLVFGGDCAGNERDAGRSELAWLAQTLARPHDGKTILIMHIPPGYDAQTTTYVRGLVAWPFLEPDANAALDALVASPRNGIAFVLSGHAHRFDFRLAGKVPVLTLGSLSPIYGNNPAFYTLRSTKAARFQISASSLTIWRRSAGMRRETSTGPGKPGARSMRRRWRGFTPVSGATRRCDGAGSSRPMAGPRVLHRRGSGLGWWRPAYCAQAFLDDGFMRCAGVGARRVALIVSAALLFAVTLVLLLLLQFARGGTPLKPP